MPISTMPVRPPVNIVIPDCCNIGVIFRSLLAVNSAVLIVALLRRNDGDWNAIVSTFIESSILVEPACLLSLAVLCGVRRLIRTIPPWSQRVVCALAPAAVTASIIHFLSSGVLVLTDLTARQGILVAALFGILLQHYFEMRTRAFSPALVEARLQSLQARIRPHFLFNSLNAVLSFIRSEPRRAETTLQDLADLFRVLMRDARDIITLQDEIQLCKQYLAIEKIRLGDRLQIEWEMAGIGEEVLRLACIPSLLLQPLLENAVHYGVEPAHEPVWIRVRMSRVIDRIEIVVTNPVSSGGNDSSLQGKQGNHLALDNIRERLALLHDVEAQITIIESDGMFEVRLRFPYVKNMKKDE